MSFLLLLLIAYIFWDVNFFIRLFCTIFIGRVFQLQRKITDTTVIYSLCTTQDVDIFLNHVTNGRFLRELDFARFHFHTLTHLYEDLKKQTSKIAMVQGATTIRYRRLISIFHPYKIQTKLIWWDSKAIYFEHQFITLADGFIRAVALSKQSIINSDAIEAIGKLPDAPIRPEIPEDLKLWLDSMEVSSQRLRKKS